MYLVFLAPFKKKKKKQKTKTPILIELFGCYCIKSVYESVGFLLIYTVCTNCNLVTLIWFYHNFTLNLEVKSLEVKFVLCQDLSILTRFLIFPYKFYDLLIICYYVIQKPKTP